MLCDVENASTGRSDEEAPDAPGLGGQGMDDLVTEALSGGVRLLDVVDLDREKAFDYAAALVPDYWLANLRAGEVEVYRDPAPDPASPTGWRYASHRVYREGESVAPLAKPDAVVAVATLTRG